MSTPFSLMTPPPTPYPAIYTKSQISPPLPKIANPLKYEFETQCKGRIYNNNYVLIS